MTYDAAVIGAGPSGAWTAYRLAQQGARVAVIDPSHPREKPCGGGVTGRALAIVRSALDQPLSAVRVRTARFLDSATGRAAVVAIRDGLQSEPLVVSSRAAFDAALLSAACRAGATIVPSRAAAVEPSAAGFTVRTAGGAMHAARCIVGADGANSLVRRTVARPFTRAQLSVATGFFAHGATSEEIVIDFVADPPGYIWSFPRPDHLAIGICAAADGGVTAASLRQYVRAWIARTGLGAGARLQPYSWPIPSLSAADLTTLPIAGAGWCLVGDAAGLVDPITREGIFFALRSAEMAAAAIAGEQSASATYTERVREEIISELTRAARLKNGFFRPRFTRLLVEALQQSGAIRGVMAALIDGTQGYRSLKWRLARTGEIRIALKALMMAW